MSENKLKVVAMMDGTIPDTSPVEAPPLRKREKQDNALRAEFERRWLRNPEQFNPASSILEQERLERCWDLIAPLLSPGIRVADLGCGWGVLAKRMREAGAQVDAVDISNNALRRFDEEGAAGIRLIRGTLPFTPLEDGTYDLVVCTDVVADLQGHDRRLLVSELTRLINSQGKLICSTALDTRTDNALELFLSLLQTECKLHKGKLSYHGLWLQLRTWLEKPDYYLKLATDRAFFRKEWERSNRIKKRWLELQSTTPFRSWWKLRQKIHKPWLQKMLTSRATLLKLEAFCRRWRPDTTRSHVIVLATRRPLEEDLRISPHDDRQARLEKCIWT